jgi:hypothetical protein
METQRITWTQVFPKTSFSQFIDCDMAEGYWGVRTIWVTSYNGSIASRAWMIVAWEE